MRPTGAICECSDPGCECSYPCENEATVVLFRVDMYDETGTEFCSVCADDAMASGCFADECDREPVNEEYE